MQAQAEVARPLGVRLRASLSRVPDPQHVLQRARERHLRLLAPAAAPPWPQRLGRVAYLVLTCAALGAVFVGASAWFIETRVTDLMLDRVTARAVDQVQLGVLQRVRAADFGLPHTPEKIAALAERLDPLLARAQGTDSGILRVTLVALDGTVVYSDLPSLRGQVESPVADPLLMDALGGRVRAGISSLSRPANADLKPLYGEAFATYVPITVDDQVLGAYELYQNLGPMQPLRSLLRSLLWGTLMVGLCLGVMVAIAEHHRVGTTKELPTALEAQGDDAGAQKQQVLGAADQAVTHPPTQRQAHTRVASSSVASCAAPVAAARSIRGA